MARLPVVIFGNGLGDHMLALPALRALAAIFEGRLALVALPGAADLFFQQIAFRSICETHMRRGTEGKLFDAERVVKEVGPADLVLSLNPWHSISVNQVLGLWDAPRSIGFHSKFIDHLSLNYNKHSADLAFDLPRRFNSKLRIEEFAGPPVVSKRTFDSVRRIRASFPAHMKILTVHADTGLWTAEGGRAYGVQVPAERVLGNKMWEPARFAEVLDAFLSRHPDFAAIVVGAVDLGLADGRHRDRIIPCYGLPINLSFALVGNSDLFLGVDSCMLHAADLYRVPGVGLFGPTNPREFGFRFGPHAHLSEPSMDSINVDSVLASLESLLPDGSRAAARAYMKDSAK